MNQTSEATVTLQAVSEEASPYPAYLLPRGGTGLCLFAAGFYGQNDAIHMARKNMTVTCVDRDADKLWTMAEMYPEGWAFAAVDVWNFAEDKARHGDRYDVVSVDPFFGDAAEKAWETMYLWTTLARSLVTLTVGTSQHLNVPDGWTASYFPRSDRAAWMVLKR